MSRMSVEIYGCKGGGSGTLRDGQNSDIREAGDPRNGWGARLRPCRAQPRLPISTKVPLGAAEETPGHCGPVHQQVSPGRYLYSGESYPRLWWSPG